MSAVLTRREREVVELVGRGMTYGEAAAVLRLSVSAVGARASRAYAKLGVGNIREALAVLRKCKKAPSSGTGERAVTLFAEEDGSARRPTTA